MGKGIQIKKPDQTGMKPALEPISSSSPATLSPTLYLMLILTFPAALVALYFFLQTRA